MNGLSPNPRTAPRWPVALAIVAVIILQALLPRRILLFPPWFPYVFVAIILVIMALAAMASVKVLWQRLERIVLLVFCGLAVLMTAGNLLNLITTILRHTGAVDGLQLLSSSVVVWVANVVVFSILYWEIDRGGPDHREQAAPSERDWMFPQDGLPAEDLPPGWRPTYVDYLFLGYCTGTAFSPTDALPITTRAKALMLLQSTISLATIVVVASRAISILV